MLSAQWPGKADKQAVKQLAFEQVKGSFVALVERIVEKIRIK